jgi:poly(A) polymerase
MTLMANDSAVASLLQRPAVARLLDVLNGEGEETRIVGGAVRNALIGHAVGDIDLATTAGPAEVTRRVAGAGFKAVPTGIEHGTLTVVVDGAPFEVTTLREDIATDGRRATVRFGRDFKRDAERRDFTINALSVDREGVLHDTVGGVADLKARRVRFIGDAATRIREDFLRTLRLFRFHAQFGEGDIDPDAVAAAMQEREGLRILSRERVSAEFLKLLKAPGAAATVALMAELGFLGYVTGGVSEHGRLRRLIAAETARGSAPDTIARLMALAVFVADDADRLRESLRLSNAAHERMLAMAALTMVLHDEAAPLDARAVRGLAVEHGLAVVRDVVAMVDGEPRPVVTDAGRAALAAMASGEAPVPTFPLTGTHVMARGIAAGPQIGLILARARRLWLAADCPSDKKTIGAMLDAAVGEARDSR